MKQFLSILAVAAACAAAAAQAQTTPVTAEGAWARATVQGQKASGAFMTLTARERLSLVGVATPAAGVAEVHEMKLEGEVMRMRAVAALELPAGKPVELKAGGYHLMLLDLKAPLRAGTQVPLTLHFRNAKGDTTQLQLAVPVLARAPDKAAPHKH